MALDVTYYTDPLCSWSWAFEPVWRRVRAAYDGRMIWRYRMGGLIEDVRSFRDPVNDIVRPAQLAPLWYQVSQLTGVPIDARLWTVDPPASSFPACIAVKAAEMQGADASDAYLRRLRAAVMCGQQNPARAAVLIDVARAVAAVQPFDVERFTADVQGEEAHAAFADDLRDVRQRGITRFPALVVRGPRGARLTVGYRPFEMICEVLRAVDADAHAMTRCDGPQGGGPST